MTKQIDIFVFGSNEAGIHGAGAAKHALSWHGAVLGQGYGLQGSSFAIPTKDKSVKTLPLESIEKYVKLFLEFAQENQQYRFFVTQIGCGLAGYTVPQIAPMFKKVPNNVLLPKAFLDFLYQEYDISRISFDI